MGYTLQRFGLKNMRVKLLILSFIILLPHIVVDRAQLAPPALLTRRHSSTIIGPHYDRRSASLHWPSRDLPFARAALGPPRARALEAIRAPRIRLGFAIVMTSWLHPTGSNPRTPVSIG